MRALGLSLSFFLGVLDLGASDLSFLTAVKSFLSCFSSASGPRSSSGSCRTGFVFLERFRADRRRRTQIRSPILMRKSSVTGEREDLVLDLVLAGFDRLAISTSCSRERNWKLPISLR